MDTRYHDYCLADRFFYELPGRSAAGATAFGAGRELPAGWHMRATAGWTMLAPGEAKLPPQGWKIHVSACLAEAADVLGIVWDYCAAHQVAFKFLTTRADFLVRNAKYADRAGSGKFITVYPAGDTQLEHALGALGAALSGRAGPYILSDARIGDGPLYVRYGGFAEKFCLSGDGELVPAIEDPQGVLVPDDRQPAFRVPAWAPVPGVVAPHLAARQSGNGSGDFPYTVRTALHFTNGGGLYAASDQRSGRQVVLREARPHAALDSAGRDAVARLGRERDALRALAGLPCVPAVYDYFTCWEHHFLAEEFVEGQTLGAEMASRFPLVTAEPDDRAVAEYTEWALATLHNVEAALGQVHERGVTFGDLHPHNILARPGGGICLIDFEAASLPGEPAAAMMGAPGYLPPDRRAGRDLDNYAMACLRIAMFLPLTALIPLDPGKAGGLLEVIASRFPVPAGFCAATRAALALGAGAAGPRIGPRAAGSGAGPRTADYRPADHQGADHAAADHGVADGGAGSGAAGLTGRAAVESMARAIGLSATPWRADRLFPGDIRQFSDGGLGLAYGAAGVLHALAVTGCDIRPEYEKWLVEATRRTTAGPGGARPGGLYDGIHGAAYVLDEIGSADVALNLMGDLLHASLDGVPASLAGGLPGIGLNLLHFAARGGGREMRTAALNVADRLAGMAAALPPAGVPGPRSRSGLMYGGAGRALFLIRVYQDTGDEALLGLARRELYRDLDSCVTAPDGSLQVDEGWRLMPYLETGSAGIAYVADCYLSTRHDERLAAAIGPVIAAAEAEFFIGSGLFNGRAGLLALLTLLRDSGRRPRQEIQPAIDRHVRRMAWHALRYRGEVAFPGDQLLRLSMDLATGSAGVLLALRASQQANVPVLPLITPVPATRPGHGDGYRRSRSEPGSARAGRSASAGGGERNEPDPRAAGDGGDHAQGRQQAPGPWPRSQHPEPAALRVIAAAGSAQQPGSA